MKDNNVYRKMDNGRYVPVGIYCGDDRWLPDGIWYVRHHDNVYSMSSLKHLEVIFKTGDAKNVDLTELCGMEDLCDYIMSSQEFKNMMDSDKGFSVSDLVHICVKKLNEKKNGK